MANKHKNYSAQEKVRILRLHLIEKEPVSDICDRHGLNPNVFYRWQKVFFENGAAAQYPAFAQCDRLYYAEGQARRPSRNDPGRS
jgi:transposase